MAGGPATVNWVVVVGQMVSEQGGGGREETKCLIL